MPGTIDKGIITQIYGDKARVSPCNAPERASLWIVIPQPLRGDLGGLTKGAEVVYALFDDQTGIIIMRADGESGAEVT